MKIAKLYPGVDGKKYYFVDTEPWSESYISANVDDAKMAAICKLYDFLYSEEGKRLVFCGIEGEDYDPRDGMVVMKEGVDPARKISVHESEFQRKQHCHVESLRIGIRHSPALVRREYRELLTKQGIRMRFRNGYLPGILMMRLCSSHASEG